MWYMRTGYDIDFVVFIYCVFVFTCSYQACYKYEIVNNRKCRIIPPSSYEEAVSLIPVIVNDHGSRLFDINTPKNGGKYYPDNTICYYLIGKR